MKNTNIVNKEFFNIKSEESKQVYNIYKQCVLDRISPRDTQNLISNFLQSSFNLSSQISDSAAARIYENFSSGSFQETLLDNIVTSSVVVEVEHAKPHIVISLEDYQKFTELTQADPDITFNIKKLLLSFIIFYRLNYHPSGWIRYDKKNIFYLAGINKLSVAQQEKMTNYLHTKYGLNMRVVGSNQPTTCYNMYWLQDQPPVGGLNNPMITLGLLTPEDINNIVLKTKQ